MMGTSLLAVPWAIEHSGLAMGFTIVFVMTIISFYTAFIIIDLYGKHNSKYIHMNFLVSGMSKSHQPMILIKSFGISSLTIHFNIFVLFAIELGIEKGRKQDFLTIKVRIFTPMEEFLAAGEARSAL